MTIEQEITNLEKQLSELKDKKAKFNGLPFKYKVADAMHKKFCTANHTDGCGWYYRSWDKYRPGFDYERDSYTKKADRYLAKLIELNVPQEYSLDILESISG